MNLKSSAKNIYNILKDLIITINKHAESQRYTVIKYYSKRYLKNSLIHKNIF